MKFQVKYSSFPNVSSMEWFALLPLRLFNKKSCKQWKMICNAFYHSKWLLTKCRQNICNELISCRHFVVWKFNLNSVNCLHNRVTMSYSNIHIMFQKLFVHEKYKKLWFNQGLITYLVKRAIRPLWVFLISKLCEGWQLQTKLIKFKMHILRSENVTNTQSCNWIQHRDAPSKRILAVFQVQKFWRKTFYERMFKAVKFKFRNILARKTILDFKLFQATGLEASECSSNQ